MLCFSPFADYAVYSFGLALFLLSSVDLTGINITLSLVPDVEANMVATSVHIVRDVISYISESWYVLPDSNYIALVYIMFIHVIIYILYSAWYNNHNTVKNILNSISSFVQYKIAISYLGKHGSAYFPFIFYIFYIILCGNLFGLIPSVFSITSNLSFTLFLSSSCWLGIFLLGLNVSGIKFFRLFYPSMVPFILSPFLMFIELISFAVRLASLSLRLFANIVAGHILIETVSAFFYYISMTTNVSINIEYLLGSIALLLIVFILIIFESLIAFLQAYIFSVLVTIYLHDVYSAH